MQEIYSSLQLAFVMIGSFDPDLVEIVMLSLAVSLTAVVISLVLGLPLGAAMAMSRFRGRGGLIVFSNALMGLPPVVVGLLVYLALSRSGPLGVFNLLYTPWAMIIAQAVLVTPLVTALTREIIEQLDSEYAEYLSSLAISAPGRLCTLLWDGRFNLATVSLAGFGRAIAEVGAVMVVGGNIDHLTRVMTTAIALETSKGNLELALALGVVLMLLALGVNLVIALVRPVDAAKQRRPLFR
jgi:tungstate transport system permease protein